MSSGKVLLGIFAGVAAGAVLGILFAPDKGSNTRKKIMTKGGEYIEDLENKFNELMDRISEKLEMGKEEATQMIENGKSKMEEFNQK